MRINTDPRADMFTTVKEKGKKSTFAEGFITVDFACLGCHGRRYGEWVAGNAKGFHKK